MSCLFFFQAEDGIRDTSVTGVQTCALPIFGLVATGASWLAASALVAVINSRYFLLSAATLDRSEERRVGKEWRARWWPYHSKQKKARRCTGGRRTRERETERAQPEWGLAVR